MIWNHYSLLRLLAEILTQSVIKRKTSPQASVVSFDASASLVSVISFCFRNKDRCLREMWKCPKVEALAALFRSGGGAEFLTFMFFQSNLQGSLRSRTIPLLLKHKASLATESFHLITSALTGQSALPAMQDFYPYKANFHLCVFISACIHASKSLNPFKCYLYMTEQIK